MTPIAVLIACHNRKDHTLACLAALAAQQGAPPLEIFLVDDGSRDGTAQAVAAAFPRVTLLTGDGNLYWNRAMILAQRTAMARAFAFHLWLNDDVALEPGAVAAMVADFTAEAARTGREPIIVGSLQEPDTGLLTYGGQVRTSPWHPLRLTMVQPRGRPVPCHTFHGNCVLLPRSALDALGTLDPAFSHAMGDTDYGLRATAQGIPLAVTAAFVGCCPRPGPAPAPGSSLRTRWQALNHPKGSPPRELAHLLRRHGGPSWPLPWLLLLARAWLRPPRAARAAPPLRVALFEGVAPDYRLPFFQHLAALRGFAFDCYHGNPLPGVTAPVTTHPLPLPTERVRNTYWPGGGGRVLWTTGVAHILRGGYQAVVVGHQVHNPAIWLLWLARRLGLAPRLLIFGHMQPDNPPVKHFSRLRRRIRALQLRGADALLPYTEAGQQSCLQLGIAPHRIFVVNNTLDVNQMRRQAAQPETAASRQHWRQRLAWEQGPVLLAVGRFYVGKRFDLLIDAARLLHQQGHRLHLLLVGDGAERTHLEQRAADCPWIHFPGQIVEEVQLAALFTLADVVVIPDALGLAVVHALAHGAPVVTARESRRHGPEAAYIEDGVNGVLVAPLDAATLAAALARLLTQPEWRQHLARGAWESGSVLTMEAMVTAYSRALHQAVGR